MDIDGWKMFDFEHANEDTRSRWRNYYEQEIINAQIQDTITLNKKGDFWLTPSIRYNRSKILGRSDRYDEKNDPQHIKWLGQTDEQTDDKVTWQLALKNSLTITLRCGRQAALTTGCSICTRSPATVPVFCRCPM